MLLDGRRAIVTGGGAGIGRAFAMALGEAGASVAVADVNLDGAEETVSGLKRNGITAVAVEFDQSEEASVESMVKTSQQELGGVDVLVNNAALFATLQRKSALDIDLEEWNRVVAVDLTGPFLCCRATLPGMIEAGYGKVVNMVSGAIFTARSRMAHYVSAKAGLVGLTRSLAREYGEAGIRVNAISPGSTDSKAAIATREYLERVAATRSIPRVQVPEDLTGTLVYLCSPLSDFVTGQHIVVDGGGVFQ